MGIEITTEPIDVTVDGVSFNMQGDPTTGPAWNTLMEIKVTYGDQREQVHKELLDALAALAETPEDSEIILGLTVGTPTLKRTAEAYVQAVAGFPTQPPSRSTRRSKKTGDT